MCQRFPWRGGAYPSCNASPIVHLVASHARGCQSCTRLPEASSRCFCATARTAITQRCARPLRSGAPRPVASLPGRPQPSASAPRPSTVSPRRLGQPLRHGAPASNKPHPAEKSTPVWLAIWRTWAGFANSQLRRAAFRITYLHICTHPHCTYVGLLLRHSKSFDPSAPIAYATSVSPPNEAVAWPGAQVLDVR